MYVNKSKYDIEISNFNELQYLIKMNVIIQLSSRPVEGKTRTNLVPI